MKKEKVISNIAIVYFVLGLFVAIAFALYYRWPFLSFLSPGFFAVVFTWPIQLIGFIFDLSFYGLAGKPI